MKILAWALYATLIIVVVSRNVFEAFVADSFGLRMVLSAINVSALLVALFGYVYQQAILKRALWVALFWLNIGISAFQVSILLVLAIGSQWSILPHFIDWVGCLPLLYALYCYGSIDNPIWGQAHLDEDATQLEQLLRQYASLESTSTAKQPEGTLVTRTRLCSENNHYSVRIEKAIGNEAETTRHQMSTLYEVAKFLRAHTDVRVGDFNQQRDLS